MVLLLLLSGELFVLELELLFVLLLLAGEFRVGLITLLGDLRQKLLMPGGKALVLSSELLVVLLLLSSELSVA